jgi:hypothetical protein
MKIALRVAVSTMLSLFASTGVFGQQQRFPCRHVAPQDLTTFVVISMTDVYAKRCNQPFDVRQQMMRYASYRASQRLSPDGQATLRACFGVLEAGHLRNMRRAPRRDVCTPDDLVAYTRIKARLDAGDYPIK